MSFDLAILRFEVEDLVEVETDFGSVWRGRLLLDGESYSIERRGGWSIEVGGERRHLLPEVAALVQDRLPASARRRRSR